MTALVLRGDARRLPRPVPVPDGQLDMFSEVTG